jgi:methyltransferase
MLIRVAVCAFAIASRFVELRFSQRNIRSYTASKEGRLSRHSFPLIVLVHASVLTGTLLFGGRPRLLLLLPFFAVQPLRAWILLTLGARWNARGIVPASMTVATNGPYALVRHPNYSVVAVELASLPAGFGLYRLAFVAGLANAVLLALRIHDEERLLIALPGYRQHFESKPRFLPGLF